MENQRDIIHKNLVCRISNFNIAFFAMIMGFAGAMIVAMKFEEVMEFDFNFSIYFVSFALSLFILVLFLYIIKSFKNFENVAKDFTHHVKFNFFPGVAKILLLFSIAFLGINIFISKILFIIGAFFQLFFTLLILKKWILHETKLETMNPLWFLPIVGNLILPIA